MNTFCILRFRKKLLSWSRSKVRTMRKSGLFTIRGSALLTLLASVVSFQAPARLRAQSANGNPARFCASSALAESTKVDQYIFRTYQSADGACLEVLHAGKIIFRSTGEGVMQYTLGQAAGDDFPAVPNATDLTGRGHPDMIVSSFTGGAHCCFAHLVFELEPDFKLLATLEDAHDDQAHFARLGADKRYYYFTADWTFAYWPSCFACSPSAEVILRFVDDGHGGGGFHLALDKMQTPAPTPAEWSKELRAAQTSARDGDITSIGTTLWGPVLNWLYDGHSDLAWKLIEEAGPKAQQKPLPTLADFCSLLRQSAYWPDLSPSLRDTPPACATALNQATKHP
jgi:hypothetical protein